MAGCGPAFYLVHSMNPPPPGRPRRRGGPRLQGINENHGESSYHSLQAKLEKRFSRGTYLLVSYTLARMRTSGADFVQSDGDFWTGLTGVISPYEQQRNWAPAANDVTHVLSAALVWDLPFGKGRKWADKDGVANAVLGGWQLSTIFRYSTGLPFFFRSSYCNVPWQFRVGCIPSITGDAFSQDKGSFDPNKGPLFDKDAFESVDVFDFYYGSGPRVSDYRGFSYRNQDLSLIKNTRLFRDVNLQLRIEVFNVWNWHSFTAPGNSYDAALHALVRFRPRSGWAGPLAGAALVLGLLAAVVVRRGAPLLDAAPAAPCD